MPIPIRPLKRKEAISEMANEELLDAVTVLVDQMDPEAIDIIHGELARRGFGPDEVGGHLRDHRNLVIKHEQGRVAMCWKCRRAAQSKHFIRHKFWGLVPLFQRIIYSCTAHVPTS